MVIYAITLQGVKDNMLGPAYKMWDYESEIVNIRATKELIDEIVNFCKDKDWFKDSDSIVIKDVKASHLALQQEYQNNIPENFKKLYSASIEAWNKEEDNLEKMLFEDNCNSIINNITTLRKKAEELKLLDSQIYLDFLDELNNLSLDQDRKEGYSN